MSGRVRRFPRAGAVLLMGLLVFGVVGSMGFALYAHFEWVDLPLERLVPYAETESYERLIERVHAHGEPEDGFMFVVLGDSRGDYGIAKQVYGRAAADQPLFIMNTGDIVRRGMVEEYEAQFMALVDLVAPIPVIPVPGNHERGPNRDFSPFTTIYGSDRFSFDYGGCRFVGVNNSDRYGMTRDELAFLDRELSKPGVDHRFVFYHIPPRFMRTGEGRDYERGFRWNARRSHRLLARHKVDHVFMAHIHGYYTEVIDGVRYTITGGAGAPLAEHLGEMGAVHNYIVVRVTPEGLDTRVMRLVDGEWVESPVE